MTLITVNLPEACWPPRCTCTIAQLLQATFTGATRRNVPAYHLRLEPEPSAASSSLTTTQSIVVRIVLRSTFLVLVLDRKVLKVQLACMHLKNVVWSSHRCATIITVTIATATIFFVRITWHLLQKSPKQCITTIVSANFLFISHISWFRYLLC